MSGTGRGNRPGSSDGPGRSRPLAQHAGDDGAADLVDDCADLGAVTAQASVGAGAALQLDLSLESEAGVAGERQLEVLEPVERPAAVGAREHAADEHVAAVVAR